MSSLLFSKLEPSWHFSSKQTILWNIFKYIFKKIKPCPTVSGRAGINRDGFLKFSWNLPALQREQIYLLQLWCCLQCHLSPSWLVTVAHCPCPRAQGSTENPKGIYSCKLHPNNLLGKVPFSTFINGPSIILLLWGRKTLNLPWKTNFLGLFFLQRAILWGKALRRTEDFRERVRSSHWPSPGITAQSEAA